MGVGLDEVHDVEAEGSGEDEREVKTFVCKRGIQPERHDGPRVAYILTASGSNTPLPVVIEDKVANAGVLILVVDTYLLAVRIERLPVLGIAEGVVGVLRTPLV